MMRLHDWEARLSRYITTVAREGFAWGRHDCALFAAGGVLAVRGDDPAAAWRGQYADEAQGLALIRAAGFADHVAAARAVLPQVAPLLAMAGDLAVIDGDRGAALGIVQGEMIYVLRPALRGRPALGLVPVETAVQLLGVR